MQGDFPWSHHETTEGRTTLRLLPLEDLTTREKSRTVASGPDAFMRAIVSYHRAPGAHRFLLRTFTVEARRPGQQLGLDDTLEPGTASQLPR